MVKSIFAPSRRSAFTLIELLLVISSIASLTSIVVVSVNPAKQLEKTQDAKIVSDNRTIQDAIQLAEVQGTRFSTKIAEVSGILEAQGISLSENGIPICLETQNSAQNGCLSLQYLVDQGDLGSIPINPKQKDTGSTGYKLFIDSNGNVVIASSVTKCGDFRELGEACDDGNPKNGDGCTTCKIDATYRCTTDVGFESECKPMCGNNQYDQGEACDDGNDDNGDYCNSTCSEITGECNDSILQENEVCDDGNKNNGDYCSSTCSQVTGECSDGSVQGNEACDDGFKVSGDGCSEDCKSVEAGWSCSGTPSTCEAICGDEALIDVEVCDDGNTLNGDGCKGDCKSVEAGWSCSGTPSTCEAICGDSLTLGLELCDDGNELSGDGCSEDCESIETGWSCSGTPSTCAEICGDDVIIGVEVCDDGNTLNGDGCSEDCEIVEDGWSCSGTPSTCEAICGDNLTLGIEECDDGNELNGDGCSEDCESIETGWSCSGTPSTCAEICGDDVIIGVEVCDDGNEVNGDYCNSTCSEITGKCSDSILQENEVCDDGNELQGDGCKGDCKSIEDGWSCSGTPSTCAEICGDDVIIGVEVCDDGNTLNGDGCSEDCEIVEDGWSCSGTPSTCEAICGDNLTLGIEECDDGNELNGDGCSEDCESIETGWSCSGTPSTCAEICGDDVIIGVEVCDDGNTSNEDYCNSTCTVVTGSCGDGSVQGNEACDDGNTTINDGCNELCITEELIAHWMYSEGGGTTTADVSGHGYNGVLNNGPQFIPNVPLEIVSGAEYSIYFDGSNDYITVPNLDLAKFTLSSWVKIDAYASPYPAILVSQNSFGWSVGYNASNKVFLSKVDKNEEASTLSVPTDSNWHHIAVSYNGAHVSFYIDGVLSNTSAYTETFNSNGGNYFLGKRGNENANQLNGKLFDTRLYNYALSPTQITTFLCGDGVIVGAETCDDRNNTTGDGCTSSCVQEICGDAIVNNSNTEECDSGFMNSDSMQDRCRTTCELPSCGDNVCDSIETNQNCYQDCQPLCGNSVIELDEQGSQVEDCDEGSEVNGITSSCCSAICLFKQNTVKCRDSVGICDADDYCSGASSICTDAKSTSECRTRTQDCDPAEICNGIDNNCPENILSDEGLCPPVMTCTNSLCYYP